jgi:hypothetical protein
MLVVHSIPEESLVYHRLLIHQIINLKRPSLLHHLPFSAAMP